MTGGDHEERGQDLALGIAGPAEEAEAERDLRLDAEKRAWEGRLARIATALPPEEPQPALWERITRTLDAELPPVPGAITVRAEAGEWQPLDRGVQIKLLSRDVTRQRQCFLLRLAPGARLRRHQHEQAEECLMLEGDLSFGPLELKAGDFQYLPAGVAHPVGVSRNGCLAFVSGAL